MVNDAKPALYDVWDRIAVGVFLALIVGLVWWPIIQAAIKGPVGGWAASFRPAVHDPAQEACMMEPPGVRREACIALFNRRPW